MSNLDCLPGRARGASKFRNPNGDVLVFPSRKWPTAKPYTIDRPWDIALKQAKIGDFRFHDLRHTAASYAAQSRASLLKAADLLGHKAMQMVTRYAHLSTESKRRLVERTFGEIK
jgi:integrase